jgi:hypothetical protein
MSLTIILLVGVAKAAIGGIVGAFVGFYAEVFYRLHFTATPIEKLPRPVVTPVIASIVGAAVALAVECFIPPGKARRFLEGMLYGAIGATLAAHIPLSFLQLWQRLDTGIEVVTEADRTACGRIGLALVIVCVTAGGIWGRGFGNKPPEEAEMQIER